MTIKQEIKSFYSKLRKEIKKRERYVASKPVSWQISEAGEDYISTTAYLKSLQHNIFLDCKNLGITFK